LRHAWLSSETAVSARNNKEKSFFEAMDCIFFMVVNNSFAQDAEKPSVPYGIKASTKTPTSITLNWEGSKDNVGVVEYWVMVQNLNLGEQSADKRIVVSENSPEFTTTSVELSDLVPLANYEVKLIAREAAGNSSDASSVEKTGKQYSVYFGRAAG